MQGWKIDLKRVYISAYTLKNLVVCHIQDKNYKKLKKARAISSLSNSRRHSANADAIADVKSKIIVSCQHFFADVIYSAT